MTEEIGNFVAMIVSGIWTIVTFSPIATIIVVIIVAAAIFLKKI